MRQALAPVISIAKEAGQAIFSVYAQMQDETLRSAMVSHKADHSPVTAADLAAHHVIVAQLKDLTPDIPVVSEEDAESLIHRQPQGQFWLVDPLDGTKEFLARNGEFTVNIALIADGIPVLGVVYAPVFDLMFWGAQGEGAWCAQSGNVRPIEVARSVKPGQPVRVVASRSHMSPETAALIDGLGPHELVQAGSSLKFCRIADGSADIYPRLGPTCEWDTAAAQAVVEAAGGVVVTLDGAPLRYGKAELLNPYFVASAMPWPRPLPGAA